MSRKRPERLAFSARKFPKLGVPNPSVALPVYVPNDPQLASKLPYGWVAPNPDRVVAFTTKLVLSPYCASGDPVISSMPCSGVERNLRGKQLALLVAHRLAIDHEGGLRVIAQRMKESIGVRRHRTGAIGDGVAQSGARTGHRQFRENAGVHVLMSGRIGFHRRRGGLHCDRARLRRYTQRDIRHHRHRVANFNVLLDGVESGGIDYQPVIVHRDAIEAIFAVGVGHGHLFEAGDRIGEHHLRAGNERAGGISHLTGQSSAVDGLSESGRGRQHGHPTHCPKQLHHPIIAFIIAGTDIVDSTSWTSDAAIID